MRQTTDFRKAADPNCCVKRTAQAASAVGLGLACANELAKKTRTQSKRETKAIVITARGLIDSTAQLDSCWSVVGPNM